MNISVFGLGYVGAVSSACLAEMGHRVTGVDVDEFKVDAINRGESPIVEELISELIAGERAAGRLHATTDIVAAVLGTDLSLVCVGTPSTESGGLDTRHVARVAEQIGAALRGKPDWHVVVVRSTILPGTVEEIVLPLLEKHSGKRCGEGFGLCFHPEFLREGSSVKDFRNPPKIVIGSSDRRAADTLASLYTGFDAPLLVTSIRTAEMVKYADNAFHALKIVFANEIGALCKTLGIDSHQVMDIFCADTRLNISPAYLKPGFAYGGSCLPKDLRALLHMARANNLEMPMLANLARSNELHINRVLDLILAADRRDVTVLGLSFKPGTDDLRESPMVELVERLIGKGCRVRVCDGHVAIARMRGGNLSFIERKCPHIADLLMGDLDAAVAGGGVIVVGAKTPEFIGAVTRLGAGKVIVDLVRAVDPGAAPFAEYHGVCW